MLRRSIATCVICSLLICVLLGLPAELGAQNNSRSLNQKLKEIHQKLDRFENQRQQTRQELRQRQQKLQQYRRKEHGLLGVLERYDREIRRRQRRVRRLRKRVKRTRQQIEETRRELTRTRHELEQRRSLLKRRIVGLYKQGQWMHASILLGARSLSDFLTRLEYFRSVLKQDRNVIQTFRQTRDRLRELTDQRRAQLARLERQRQELERSLERHRTIRRARKNDLQEIRQSKQFQTRRIRELESQQQRMNEMVARLQKKKSRARNRLKQLRGEFKALRGSLPWPVAQNRILRPFGTWSENGITHTNDGVDIAVSSREPVRAVARGRVLYARFYRGMGQVVIVRHPGQYLTLYGSLVNVRVREGDDVRQGDVLGRAGQTSGMDQPRLYFQMFHGKTVLDPTNWLK